ncbi:MAG: DNA gyrase inhibitor YacG [Alphaproteobacteria bacterium]|nr:DNA gyrase inhibitor YacG [Alphaproteobacteria bacterium]
MCPICQKPTHTDFAPFCSKVCKNIDLLRWLNEEYRIPTEDPLKEEETPPDNEESDH